MRLVLKIRKKGIIILPKKLREALGVGEGDEVVAEVSGRKLILRALKPKVVNIDPSLVEELLHEEYSLEKNRFERMVYGGEVSS